MELENELGKLTEQINQNKQLEAELGARNQILTSSNSDAEERLVNIRSQITAEQEMLSESITRLA